MALDDFRDWIGCSITRHDVVTERIVEQFRATLSPHLLDTACPPGLHWCLAVAATRPEDLGADGAEQKGTFIPPIPLSRRMWGGGRVETLGSLRLGMHVERHSRIADIQWRQGTSGRLCIVSIVHEFNAGSQPVVRERQDLLFREGPPGPSSAPAAAAGGATLAWTVEATPLLLFRYSALTFNSHRIHYDLDYARQTEGYDGVLVHGTLQATLMLNQLAAGNGGIPRTFDYRCVAPLTAGQALSVTCNEGEGRIVNAAGVTTLVARAQ